MNIGLVRAVNCSTKLQDVLKFWEDSTSIVHQQTSMGVCLHVKPDLAIHDYRSCKGHLAVNCSTKLTVLGRFRLEISGKTARVKELQ